MKHWLLITLMLFCGFSLSAELRKVKIIQTTDVHSHFGGNSPEDNGNFLKLASLIKEEVKSAGGESNVVLIDCGDLIQGSFTAAVSRGEAIIPAVNALKYDAWIIGNHDYDFGFERLAELSKKAECAKLAANIKVPSVKMGFKPWKMYHKNGLRIAVIGMTYPILYNYLWHSPVDFKLFSLEKSVDFYMPEIMQHKPDMIILAVHYADMPGRKNDENDLGTIAYKHPEINLMLGGHFHTEDPGSPSGKVSWYGCSGRHAERIFVAEAEFDTDAHKVNKISSRLSSVSASTKEDEEIKKVLAPYFEKADSESSKVLGRTLFPISRDLDKPCSTMSTLVSSAIAESAKAPVCIYSCPTNEVLKGDITEKNIYMILPYEDAISTLELSRQDIAEIISEQVRQRGLKNFQMPWGLHVSVKEDGSIIGSLSIDADTDPADKDKKFLVASTGYILGGAGGKFPILRKLASDPSKNAFNTGIPVRNALREYIMKNSPLNIKNEAWLNFAASAALWQKKEGQKKHDGKTGVNNNNE